ncbi:MAG TPA: Xaa-Pro peptidase family protein [Candidatus Saccharimonadales bacterium]|nr:Xaa-Pro peptidase family protein [Candidatus Saccharimonadales bacterium]
MDSQFNVFPDEEYTGRLERIRARMDEERFDVCMLSAPENIYYLTGLNHWGFFGLHLLIVPKKGDLCLIARKMETVTITNQVADKAEFRGYLDSESAADFTADIMKEKGFEKATIGIDMGAQYRSYADTKRLMDGLPDANWKNSQDLMTKIRMIKTPLEIAAMRQAGVISERMTEAAIRAIAPGVNEKAVAAEVYKEMILAGSESPSFGPFLRPTARRGEEHTTWGNQFLTPDDTMFIELSGSYQRYHAPMGRFVHLNPPEGQEEIQKICLEAFNAVVENLRPGMIVKDVYAAWQNVVNEAGLSDYQRHHCGYMVGLSFPPAWAECGDQNTNLNKNSNMVLEAGMTFHVLSWLVGSRLGDDFISNTVLVTENGGEVLTTTSQNILTA